MESKIDHEKKAKRPAFGYAIPGVSGGKKMKEKPISKHGSAPSQGTPVKVKGETILRLSGVH